VNKLEFHKPTSIKDAVALRKSKPEGKFLAGGQSLIPVLKLDLAAPSDLISLAALSELRQIKRDGNKLAIGALVTHDEVHRSPEVAKAIAALATLAGGIGDQQVRNRGTLGGSVAHADPAADYPAAVLGLGATIITDRRSIAADAYFTGFFETALGADELVTAVQFPIAKRAGYVKFANRASRYAVVGVFIAETDAGIRVAVTGAGAKVFRVTAMEQALAKSFTAASVTGVKIDPADLTGDPEASAEYRAHLIPVIAGRAVQAALG
jgi:carbon-monoxide dehydrogenase medium subunit